MLEIKELSVSYRKLQVLHSLSLSVCEGEITALIGVNGSGKSTLLRAIVGITEKSGGNIYIDGNDISAMSSRERARNIAYLSQWHPFVDMTVYEAVLQGRYPHLSYPCKYRSEDREAALAAMARVGILDLSEKPLSELSGGMRQSVYIAMALAQNAKYILLDEPLTYLDISNTVSLIGILRELREEGRGILIVMHDIPTALSFADKLAVLSGGEISAFGTADEVLKSGIIKSALGADIFSSADGFGYLLK